MKAPPRTRLRDAIRRRCRWICCVGLLFAVMAAALANVNYAQTEMRYLRRRAGELHLWGVARANGSTTSTGVLDDDTDVLVPPAPPPPPPPPLLFVGVLSAPGNLERRYAYRASMMSHPAVSSGVVRMRFFLALSGDEATDAKVRNETAEFRDIVTLDYVEHYRKIARKTLAIVLHGVRNVSARFVMKADDDSYIHVDRVLRVLRIRLNATSPSLMYWGMLAQHGEKPIRDRTSQWYLSTDEYSASTFPVFAFGVGYIIQDVIAAWISAHESSLRILPLEDVSTGTWVDAAIKAGLKVEYFHDGGVTNYRASDCGKIVVTHYVVPKDMLCWFKRQLAGAGDWCGPC